MNVTCREARIMIVFFVFHILFCIPPSFAEIKGISGLDDDALYRIDWNSKSNVPKTLPLLVSTNLGEKYECDIPTVTPNTNKNEEHENISISEIELLNQVFTAEPCAVRTEFYWTYELCHKAHLRQYHEEYKPDKTVSSRQEYFLGYLDKTGLNTQAYPSNTVTQQKPPQISLGEYAYPYFPINFTMGDVCDLTQQHRVATVLYICFEDLEGQIIEVAEVESCRYQVIFATRHLCAHPAYRRHYKTVNLIPCRPRNASPIKPVGLTTLENEQRELSAKGFSNLAALFEANGLGKIRVDAEQRQNMIIYRIRSTSEEDEVQVKTDSDAASKGGKQNPGNQPNTDPD